MKKSAFAAAVLELGNKKGIEREKIEEALKYAFSFAINKKIEDDSRVVHTKTKIKRVVKLNEFGEPEEPKYVKPDAIKVRVDANLDKGIINTFVQKEVVATDDEITDDALQICLEEAKKEFPKIKVGDFYETPFDFENLFNKRDVDKFIGAFKQKISESEKEVLAKVFEEKIHTNMSGVVEKADGRIVIVKLLDRASATLQHKDLIGNEQFRNGDIVKVYVKGISSGNKRDGLIEASRSCPEFLAEVFKDEVSEIHDGTVEIKAIARFPGKRAKVAVLSHDANVDAVGACIGKNGDRIQKIVANIGGKEHIDVFLYKENKGLFLAEILKPAEVIGVNFSSDEEGNESAVVVCKNDTAGVAISGGLNPSLLKKMMGLKGVFIYNESELEERGIKGYKTIEQFILEDEENKKEAERKQFLEKSIEYNEAYKAQVEEDRKAQEAYEASLNLDGIDENEEEKSNEPKAPIEIKIKMPEVEEKVEEEKPVQVKKVEPVEHKEVSTTTTLDELEKSLESEKKTKPSEKPSKKKNKKDDKKEDKEETSLSPKMSIYTDDELQEFEDDFDDEDFDDSDDDYSEYDTDDMYEE